MIEFKFNVGDIVAVDKWALRTFGGTVINAGEHVRIVAKHGGEFDMHPRYNVETVEKNERICARKCNNVKEEDLCALK